MLKMDLAEIANERYRINTASEYSRIIRNRNKKIGRIASLSIGIVLGIVAGTFHYISVSAKYAEIEPKTSQVVKVSTEEENPLEIDFRTVEMTYYTETDNNCANGKRPRFGICAYQKSDIGKCAIVYSSNWELIGIFEIYDTGYGRTESNGKGTIQNGNCIDIFMESDSAGRKLIEKYGNEVHIQIVEAKG